MAGDDHGHVARQGGEPVLELADASEVEMVGRLVEQQEIGLGDRDAGEHGEPLPATAQLSERALTQRFGHIECVERDLDAPALALRLLGRQRAEHQLPERQFSEPWRDVLLDMPDAQAARAGDFAAAGLGRAGEAAEQGRFAPAIGGDEAEPVARGDREGEVGKQRRAQRDAELPQIDHGHGSGLWTARAVIRRGAPGAPCLECETPERRRLD